MKKASVVSRTIMLLLISVSVNYAQEKPNPTRQSHLQAKQILDAGLDALGGMENIRRADKITINYKAVNHPLGQNAGNFPATSLSANHSSKQPHPRGGKNKGIGPTPK